MYRGWQMPAKFFFFCTLYVMCWCNGSKSPRATMCEMPCSSSNGSENPAEQLPRNRPGMISWIGLLAVFILHFLAEKASLCETFIRLSLSETHFSDQASPSTWYFWTLFTIHCKDHTWAIYNYKDKLATSWSLKSNLHKRGKQLATSMLDSSNSVSNIYLSANIFLTSGTVSRQLTGPAFAPQ